MMEGLKILKFRIENFYFGIELKYLKEVGKFKDFFEIPTPVPYFVGIFNLRGNILPLINIGKKFGIDKKLPYEKEKIFLIINDSEHTFGIYVDEIIGIKFFSHDDIFSDTVNKKNKIIHDNGDIISLIDVKDIINVKDFKFKKSFIFKGVEIFEEIKKEKEKVEKISFTIFNFNGEYFAINSEKIKILLSANIENFTFSGFSNIICGELEYEKRIIPVINLPLLLGINFNYSEKLDDYYICVIELNEKYIAFLTYYMTEFLEISKDEILIEENIFSKLTFTDECFKLDEKLIKIINLEKVIDFLKTGKALNS